MSVLRANNHAHERFYVNAPVDYIEPPAKDPFQQQQQERMYSASRSTPPTIPEVSGIIGIAGPAGVGKDTFVALLSNYLSMFEQWWHVLHDSFAAPLYAGISVMTGIPEYVLRDRRYKDVPINWPGAPSGLEAWTPRKLLKWMGTECMRDQVCRSFWVDRFNERSARWLKPITDSKKIKGRVILLSDVRYDNEATCCDLMIELARDGVQYENPDGHSSAQRLPEHCIDVILTVDASTDYYQLCSETMHLLVYHKQLKLANA